MLAVAREYEYRSTSFSDKMFRSKKILTLKILQRRLIIDKSCLTDNLDFWIARGRAI